LAYLIGKKGQRAQELRRLIGTNLDFDFENGTLTICGDVEMVEKGKDKIMETINEYETSRVIDEYYINPAGRIIIYFRHFSSLFITVLDTS